MSVLRLLAAIIVLAGLDSAAAVLFKEASIQRNPMYVIYGISLMVAVAGVLMFTLEIADLTIVSLGWIILFQAVIMVVDHFRYHVTPGKIQGAAIVVAMAALCVAAVAPTAKPAAEQTNPQPDKIPHQRGPSLGDRVETFLEDQWQGNR